MNSGNKDKDQQIFLQGEYNRLVLFVFYLNKIIHNGDNLTKITIILTVDCIGQVFEYER